MCSISVNICPSEPSLQTGQRAENCNSCTFGICSLLAGVLVRFGAAAGQMSHLRWKGDLLRDEVFLPANGGSALQEDQLQIGPGGDAHSVCLLNGTVLIPREHFEEI